MREGIAEVDFAELLARLRRPGVTSSSFRVLVRDEDGIAELECMVRLVSE